jgi:CheY-like chemotaxis protein
MENGYQNRIMTTTSKNIVFYADDDPDDLYLVEDAFATYAKNVEVVTAADGGKALQYFEKLENSAPAPCLIILDINMPEVNGKDVLIKLRQMERFSEVPVVLFTTSTQPLDVIFAKKYKAGFVTKPLNLRQMESITDRFIDHCTEEVQSQIRKPH